MIIKHLMFFNVVHKSNPTLKQCTAKGLKSLTCLYRKDIWKLNLDKQNTHNESTVANPWIERLIRFANFSPKPAESEENLRKQSDNNNEKNQDNKELPDQRDSRTMPRLMNFPEIMWPTVINYIKNWITVQFIIRPYMDREFNIQDFCHGAKKAIAVISSNLMNSDFTALNNLVTTEAMTELTPVVQKLSVSQRRQLEVKESDIYLIFPYQVGIIFDETNEKVQKRWVEISMIFHVLRGLRELQEGGEEIPWNMGLVPEYQDKMFVCNYRFIKEFTSGQESDWNVNIVNHFKPIDILNEAKREE